MSKILEEVLDIIERKDKNIAEISKESGVLAERLYSWRAKRGKPKGEDSVKLQNWLNKYRGVKSGVLEENAVKGGGSLSLGDLATLQVRSEARLTVLLEAVAEVLAGQRGLTAADVRLSLESAVKAKEADLKVELGKK